MREDEDVELMLAFKRGDYNAFAVLVERHQRPLIQFFYAQCHDLQLAEDCTQEVWRKIFRSRGDYAPRARFRTYLLRVARNYWIDVFRSRKRGATTVELDSSQSDEGSDSSWAGSIADEKSVTPTEVLGERELRGRIEYALERLPDSMREVFVMAEFQGLKYAEISEALEIPVGTVKSRMFNAIRRLRELLKKEMN